MLQVSRFDIGRYELVRIDRCSLMSSSETNARNRELRSKRRFDETSSSTNPQRPPWPRTENTPFDVSGYDDPKAAINSNECRQRPLSDNWDDYDSLFYNAWLGVS
ncbi:hypothetical protein IGI04_014753 [Brassica rapa subsp. trilocularis]|uniref:Uncharacterized protein n=1 Tax=Brassica rapa subsp. trilocularis TaxID=1813537 RepID=A0ABQ7MR62_BRACM|nr:hypothetical protein IGI04_014753 [Brassica rapa subsp. trilocularis]